MSSSAPQLLVQIETPVDGPKRAATLTGVAVGHEGVVVVGAVGAVGVAFAVAGIVCRPALRV